MFLSPDDITIGKRYRKDVDLGINELCKSIESLGQLQPVIVDTNRNLIVGARRHRACELLNREVWVEEVDGLDALAEKLKAEHDENTCRLPFTISEAVEMGAAIEAIEKPKAEARKKKTQAKPGQQIGIGGGKFPPPIEATAGDGNQDDLTEIEMPNESSGKTRDIVAENVGMSGRTYDKAKAVIAAAKALDATPEIIAAAKEMDATGKVHPAYEKIKPHVANNSGNNEWYTPAQFVESAREVMQAIDLDPASCKVANKIVKAGSYFDSESDGLSKEWHGRVWLNPPYSSALIGKFAEAVTQKFETGEIQEACVLVNNATETEWCQKMLRSASCVCFTSGRIKFLDATGVPANSPLQGQAIIYFGSETDRFSKEFSKHGVCFERCSQ